MGVDLGARTLEFALRIVKLSQRLDEMPGPARVLSKQVLRSGTSIGANFAESQGAQSSPDFLSKLSISLKETYETEYWLELLTRAEIVPPQQLESLKAECSELAAILTSIVKKLKTGRN